MTFDGLVFALGALCVLIVVYFSGFAHGRRNEAQRNERISRYNNTNPLADRDEEDKSLPKQPTDTEDRYYE